MANIKEKAVKCSDKFYQRLNRTCCVLLLAAAPAVAACAATSKIGSPAVESPQMMFVQLAEDLKVDPAAGTFRLVKISQQTIYFSDRPQRIAGHIPMADYLQEWTAKAGKDNFGADPPNATLSVYEPGQTENTLAVVKITNPVVEGPDLIYRYKFLEGKMPSRGGATTLFIDWIAYRGGVYRRPIYIR